MWLDWLRKGQAEIRRRIMANPTAWILLALLIWAEWLNYEKGSDLQKICALAAPHIAIVPDRYATTVGQKLDNLCSRYEATD